MNLDKIYNLKKKVFVVTGGSGFIGTNLIKNLCSLGAITICVDVNKPKRKQKNCFFYKCNITNEKDVQINTKNIIKKFNKIDVLINLAGLATPDMKKNKNFFFKDFSDYNFDAWKKSLDINLNGIFLITKEIVNNMKKNKNGSIVNVSSDLSIISPDHSLYKPNKKLNYKGVDFNTPISYSVSKTAILGFTRYLSTLLCKSNIRVNTISPAGIYNKQPKHFVKEFSKRIPLGRMANVQEITNAIIFLSSDASSFVTGSNFVIDGGRTIV
jgi:NAD(P)-dependent dehydrogenase (short-subunit alcohol dehydrogenase family)